MGSESRSGRGKLADSKCSVIPEDSYHGGAINLDCFYFPEDIKNGTLTNTNNRTAYTRAAAKGETDTRKSDRNRLATLLLKQSDDICTIEMGRLVGNEATSNLSLSVLTTAFSTASSIVTGDQAKSILSGLSGTANATRSHINSEVYRNALSSAITRAIENERQKVKVSVVLRFKDDADVYSVDQMVMDANSYHQICSFYRGLALVNEAVDAKKLGPAEARRAAEIAAYDLDARIAALEAQSKQVGLSAENTAGIKTQIQALRQEQTELYKARAGGTSNAPVQTTPQQ